METDEPNRPHLAEVDASPWLVHQWVVAGMVSAASRFIPIPFVDDLVREQCSRFVASRTLASNQSDLSLEDLKPYYAGGGGCLAGCTGMLVKAPLKLLLLPVRKLVAIVTSVHGVPLEIMRMVLLGRTLARYLHNGELKDAATAGRMRLAFDKSFAGMDFRVIRAAMADALSSVRGWKAAAVVSAKRTAEANRPLDDDLAAETTVDSGARKLQEVLDRPETLVLFAEFDRRFDETFRRYN